MDEIEGINESADNRVLVVGPSWIGDMIMAQPLLSLLRRRSPESEIDVLAPEATIPLVKRMPEVSAGINFKLGHGEFNFSHRRGLGEKLQQRNYRQAYILPNTFKSALVPFFANIPVRTGYRGEYRYVLLNDIRLLSEDRLPRMVDRYLALGLPVGAELPPITAPRLMVDPDNKLKLAKRLSLGSGKPVLGLCPGAEFGDAKQWPEHYFTAIADHAIRAGMQVWIFGSPADRLTGKCIRDAITEDQEMCRDLTGETTLLDAIDLLSDCRLVVANDSGLMHIAGAVGRPTIVLYGSTSPTFTPPLGEDAEILSENLSCSPCFKRTCPLGHKNCLNGLSPERVKPIIDRYAASR